jgi:hypothetical protein
MQSLPDNPFAPRKCWICGRPVSLEECKVDEHGLPVHEECHALKLSLHNAEPGHSLRPPRERASGGTRRFGRLQMA